MNVTNVCTSGSFNATSDYRIKENIQLLNNSFNVDKLIPVTYINKIIDKQDIGVIAHEIQEVYPFLVNGEKDTSSYQTVNYNGIIGILIKEVQDLKKELKIIKEKFKL
jgi:hypothetical protein